MPFLLLCSQFLVAPGLQDFPQRKQHYYFFFFTELFLGCSLIKAEFHLLVGRMASIPLMLIINFRCPVGLACVSDTVLGFG